MVDLRRGRRGARPRALRPPAAGERGVKRAINDSGRSARRGEPRPAAASPAPSSAAVAAPTPEGRDPGTRLRQWLMTGVSYMIPFVAAGGILIALGLPARRRRGRHQALRRDLRRRRQYPASPATCQLGATSTHHRPGRVRRAALRVRQDRVLHARADPGRVTSPSRMADRQGLVPGIVGGLIASIDRRRLPRRHARAACSPAPSSSPSDGSRCRAAWPGSCRWSSSRWSPRSPSAFLMVFVIGKPVKSLTDSMTDGLNGLTGTNAVLLGALLGADDGLRHGWSGQQGRLHLRRRPAWPPATSTSWRPSWPRA